MTTDPVTVRLRFFAKARELAGGLDQVRHRCESSKVCVGELLRSISSAYNLESIKDCIVLSHNQEFCLDLQHELHLQHDDELAVIPPLSGG